jgi:hypothetical protein
VFALQVTVFSHCLDTPEQKTILNRIGFDFQQTLAKVLALRDTMREKDGLRPCRTPTGLMKGFRMIRTPMHDASAKSCLSAVHTQDRFRDWKAAMSCFVALIPEALPRPAAAAAGCAIRCTDINFGSCDIVAAGNMDGSSTGTINCTDGPSYGNHTDSVVVRATVL